jgi:hypothetical protein
MPNMMFVFSLIFIPPQPEDRSGHAEGEQGVTRYDNRIKYLVINIQCHVLIDIEPLALKHPWQLWTESERFYSFPPSLPSTFLTHPA